VHVGGRARRTARFAQPLAAAAPLVRVERMSYELRNNEDFRVRTQAASPSALRKTSAPSTPLCDGLDDTSATVRAAAGAALVSSRSAEATV